MVVMDDEVEVKDGISFRRDKAFCSSLVGCWMVDWWMEVVIR